MRITSGVDLVSALMRTRIAIKMSGTWLVRLRQRGANARPEGLEKTTRGLVQASVLLENRSDEIVDVA